MSRPTHNPTRDLLPCPFCGSVKTDLVILETSNYIDELPGWWCIKCNFCGTEGPMECDAGDAMRSWNRRRSGQ